MTKKQKAKAIPITITFIFMALFAYMVTLEGQLEESHKNKPEINYEAQTEMIKQKIEKTELQLEAQKLKKEAYEKLDRANKLETSAPEVEEVKDPIKISKKVQPTIEVTQASVVPTSSVRTRQFKMNNGSYKSGQDIIDYTLNSPYGSQLWHAFNDRFGVEVADTAAVSLHYENGTLKPDSVGVCTSKHMINGDYRNCNYADLNTAGMDVGLKQINTYYQRYRIAKLGGPSCEPSNSRDITDPCTKQQAEWLKSVDNNIKVALDLYAEQGFNPWYGYKKAFNK